MLNNTDNKYTMIVTSEDERYRRKEVQLDFYWDNPWEGKLEEVVYGDTWEDLFGDGHNEGLFFQLYDNRTGTRISYGCIDLNTPKEEIEEWEKKLKKDWKDIVIEIAENLCWNVKINNNCFTFSKFSSAGRDFNIEIYADTLEDLQIELSDFYDDFDVSYETYLYLDDTGHGSNGAPYDMIDVYKDTEECKEDVEKLKYYLETALSKYEEE